jgi:hypothetical protein
VPQRSVQDVRDELITSFGDYHSPISWQSDLVAELVRAVAREERERCVMIAEEAMGEAEDGPARDTAMAIAAKLRGGGAHAPRSAPNEAA